MENKNSSLLLTLVLSAAMLAAYSIFKPSQQIQKETLPGHDYSLKVQNQVIKGYRKPAVDKKGLQKLENTSVDSSSASVSRTSSV